MNGGSPRRKKAIIILNGISLRKKLFYHEYLPAISELFDVEVKETLSKNDARALASKYTDKYVDIILAAGGDGTAHQVINGILRGREHETKLPAVGVIPIGSGNDFARGAGLTGKVDQVLEKLSSPKTRPVDVGVIEFNSSPDPGSKTDSAYFINVADIGMGPQVVDEVQKSGRPFGSAVAYYKSILKTFISYKPMIIKAIADDWTWEGKMRTLAVANGRYYGHGLCIAPDATLDDRMFSVFICGDVSVLDFIRHTGALKKGKYVSMDQLFYKTSTAISLTSDKPCPIEGDGEILGWLPARIRLIEKQLNFLL